VKEQPKIKIYLDWNIITNLIDPDRIADTLTKNTFLLLKKLLSHITDRIIIPYSNAHLNDLIHSYQKGERKRVEESLAFLSKLTGDVCLSQYWNEEFAKWHIREPSEFFYSILGDEPNAFDNWETFEESLKDVGIDKVFNMFKFIPHGMDFIQIEKHNPFFASLFPRAQEEDSMYAVIQDIYGLFLKISNNPTVYNELKKMFREGIQIDPNIGNFNNVIEQLDGYLPKTMLNKSFTELYEMNKGKQSKNKYYDKLIGLYMQLDFVGYKSEKLTPKNAYDNLFNDALHCFYAAHCDVYLTNDRKHSKKTLAIFKSENISTQVLTTTEFLDFISENSI